MPVYWEGSNIVGVTGGEASGASSWEYAEALSNLYYQTGKTVYVPDKVLGLNQDRTLISVVSVNQEANNVNKALNRETPLGINKIMYPQKEYLPQKTSSEFNTFLTIFIIIIVLMFLFKR